MRNVYVELDYNDGADKTRIFSIISDPISEGRLIGPLTFSTKVRTWIQSESTSSGLSKIKINNADGALDLFADNHFTECRIKENLNGTIKTLVTGQVNRVVLAKSELLEIDLKDETEILNVPNQDDYFPASELSQDGVNTNTYYALEAQPRPIALGSPKSIKPVLTNRAINEYQVNYFEVVTVDEVYDNGVEVLHTDYNLGFTLNTDPFGTIVADITVDETFGLLTLSDFDNFVEADFTAIGIAKPYNFSYYQDNNSTNLVSDIMAIMCHSISGWYYADELGNIRVGFLQKPDVTASQDLTVFDVVDGINIFDDTAPNITTKIGTGKNWYTYNSDDVAAGATAQNKVDLVQKWRNVVDSTETLDSFYQSTGEIYDSLIDDPADGLLEINHLVEIYSQRRRFYTFDSLAIADIGETVNLIYPRYGLDTGKNLIVYGREIDFIRNTYRLTLWG